MHPYTRQSFQTSLCSQMRLLIHSTLAFPSCTRLEASTSNSWTTVVLMPPKQRQRWARVAHLGQACHWSGERSNYILFLYSLVEVTSQALTLAFISIKLLAQDGRPMPTPWWCHQTWRAGSTLVSFSPSYPVPSSPILPLSYSSSFLFFFFAFSPLGAITHELRISDDCCVAGRWAFLSLLETLFNGRRRCYHLFLFC